MVGKFIASCLLGLALAGTAGAASVRPLQLTQIIDDATTAFQGTCVDNRTEREAATGFVVTYTTFAVKDVLKGTVPATYTIKQIGGRMPGGEMSFRVDGVPSFNIGEEYVVLMAGVSSAGFSSPIGLQQGQFTVHKDSAGSKVSNGRDFREMFAGMPAAAMRPTTKALAEGGKPVKSLDLEEFKQVVRAHAGRPR
jgi:hypothetical protein